MGRHQLRLFLTFGNLLLLGTGWTLTSRAADPLNPAEVEFFENKIRPVLVDSCYECHSASAKKLKAGLHLDSKQGLLQGGESGPALVPGDPEKSLLIKALRYTDENLQMPPKNKKLPDAVIEDFVAWVKMGAPDPRTEASLSHAKSTAPTSEPHWAFQPIHSPALPEVRHADRIQTPVDAFILSRLESKNIPPSPIADRRTLIRRATYDLTGLPPTPEEVAAFVADSSSDAYAKLVDRLLDSPRYGERWARYWLDIARYADTKGYLAGDEQRLYPYSYTYRDYVIRSFNEDLPYDRFIQEQIAADKLDLGDDQRALAALGFLTLGRRFLNNIHDIIDDRIDVVSRGLMGLTVGCARCHDHKFDPIPSADYYSLYGIFANSREPTEKPLLGTRPSEDRYQAYLAEKKRRQDKLEEFRAKKVQEALAETRHRSGEYLLAVYETQKPKDPEDADRYVQKQNLVMGVYRRWVNALESWQKEPHPVLTPWFALAALPEEEFITKSAAMIRQWAAATETTPPLNPRVIARLTNQPPSSMKELAEIYGKLLREADDAWQSTLATETKQAPEGGSAVASTPSALPDPGLEEIRLLLYAENAPANVPPGETDQLIRGAKPRLRQLQAEVDEVDATHDGAPPRAMALADNDTIRQPHIFIRGNSGNQGREVPIQFLEVVAGPTRQPFTNGSGRLELAQSIASQDNPLTARVFVNRVWLHHFGKPLVRTPSDFGTRAEPPTHPELLDYLAARFMADGWSIKKLHRLIMLSGTYQQSGAWNAQASAKDPDNLLLWRMNRQRLDFEAMRDTLLAVSGNLDLAEGGRSVDITAAEPSHRRAVYGFVERQNLPGLFRTFDFASPDTTSPQRFATTVPQQALFLMNSPFVSRQAKYLLERPDMRNLADEESKIRRLFQIAYQRDPDIEELRMALNFVQGPRPDQEDNDPRRQWQYGWGEYDTNLQRVTQFQPLPHFNNYAWQGGQELPDPQLGWVILNADGGHPGDDGHLAIRRWIAPHDGTIRIAGELNHPSEQGNGVRARVVSSRSGQAGQWEARHGSTVTQLDSLRVQEEDTVDFITDGRGDVSFDSFQWAPVIRYLVPSGQASGQTRPLLWDAKADFVGPQPKKKQGLTPWEELAQVILLSNELFFVD